MCVLSVCIVKFDRFQGRKSSPRLGYLSARVCFGDVLDTVDHQMMKVGEIYTVSK